MLEPNKRLQYARTKAGFDNASDAARKFGWNENTYRSHENGERGLKSAIAKTYAAAFKVPLSWLLIGEGEDSLLTHVPIIATIRSDGLAHQSKKEMTALGIVSLSFVPQKSSWCYIIDTHELGERYRHGDLLLCSPPSFDWTDAVLMAGIVQVETGEWYLREFLYREEDRELVLFDPTPGRRMPKKLSSVKLIHPVRAIVPEAQYSDVTGEHTISDWLSKQLQPD